MPSTTQNIKFQGSDSILSAKLDMPLGTPIAYAIFAHCFSCSKDLNATKRISQALTSKGVAVLRFDFAGLGASEGEFADSNFSSNVDDIIKAADYLRNEYSAPTLLIGHSLGGTAVLSAAGSIAEAKAVATIGSPFDPVHVKHNFADHLPEINQNGIAEVSLGGRPFQIKKQFIDDLNKHDIASQIGKMRKALLVFHSPIDDYVSVDNAASIFKAAKHPKSYISLDDADHLLRKEADSHYVADVLASWALRYFAEEKQVGPKSHPQETIVSERGSGKYTLDILSGGHQLTSDEPESVGGNDKGPTPYDLLLSALGACTVITIRMYATMKKIKLKNTIITMVHKKIHAEDCENCEASEGKIDYMERTIKFEGDISDKEKDKLIKIADKCPVHKTLTQNVHIETKLEE